MLTNDDEACIPSLSSILLAVNMYHVIQTDFPTFPLFFRGNWPQDELRQQVGGLEISQKCIVTLHSNHGCTHQELCCHTKQTRFAPILFNGKL